ncbi:hypothetical protein [Campylobacter rectus]|uniref:Uncharacterized protein n=1 Tax=Campylobacter rectus TaxID=203 RepID=A0A6G5QNS8_CAMRE|nr:hypothetical protein [Campylobacter rectus]QCD47116.1 hypothetical protein CRECT_1468 [Campylobacter rectus]
MWRDSAKFNLRVVQQPLTCSGVGEGFCVAVALAELQADGRGSAFSSSQRECVLIVANEVQLSTRRVHSTMQRKRALYFSFTTFATVASLETALLVTRRQQVAPTKKSVVRGGD